MRFRMGLVVGAGIGYVLGARAGHERYEQLKRMRASVASSPAFAQVMNQATGVTDLARNAVAGGLGVGARGLREMAEPDLVERQATSAT